MSVRDRADLGPRKTFGRSPRFASIWSSSSTDVTIDVMDVTVQQAEGQLSELLLRVELGEQITIRRDGVPIALLSRVEPPARQRRIWGTVAGGRGSNVDESLDDFAPYQ